MKRRLIGHYEFVRKIGAGGSGVVFLAQDTLLQRPVVLKLLKRGGLTLDQVRTTQLREARLASAIDHPNVCAIYEVGEAPAEDGEQTEAYIVMQYIPGQGLDKLISAGAANLQLVLSGRHPDRGWARRRALARHLSSRPEARQRHADRRRSDQDPGLRPGAAG